MTAKRIAGFGAKVVDLDDDALSSGERSIVVVWVGLRGHTVTFTTAGTRTGAGTDTEQILRSGSVEAWIAVPTTGSGRGIAISGAKGLASAISI